jgi:hypothetical protein
MRRRRTVQWCWVGAASDYYWIRPVSLRPSAAGLPIFYEVGGGEGKTDLMEGEGGGGAALLRMGREEPPCITMRERGLIGGVSIVSWLAHLLPRHLYHCSRLTLYTRVSHL